jgi:hypothetical protein
MAPGVAFRPLPFAVQSAIRNSQSAIRSSPCRRRLNDAAAKRGALLPFAVQFAIRNSFVAVPATAQR